MYYELTAYSSIRWVYSFINHKWHVVTSTNTYRLISSRALWRVSAGYRIRLHKDASDSRISDDSRDKWARAQPKYGGELNKKVSKRAISLCTMKQFWYTNIFFIKTVFFVFHITNPSLKIITRLKSNSFNNVLF